MTKTHSILARTCSLLLVTSTLLVSSLHAESISMSYSAGGSSATTTPGVKLTIPAFTAPEQSAWELTSFTWLSSSGSSALATGRGYISIFDSTLFSPTGMTAAAVNSATTGLIARSNVYDVATGTYSFSSSVLLEAGKSYYILNSNALSTTLAPAAPYAYGFSNSVSLTGIERWLVSGTPSAWNPQAGAPNFSAALSAVVAIPEPATAVALCGFAGLATAAVRRKRRA